MLVNIKDWAIAAFLCSAMRSFLVSVVDFAVSVLLCDHLICRVVISNLDTCHALHSHASTLRLMLSAITLCELQSGSSAASRVAHYCMWCFGQGNRTS